MLTAITGTTLLVCQSNRLVDNSTNNLTVTRTGDIRVTAFSPFAATAVYNPAVHGGSMYLDGTGDYLTTQSSFDGTVMSTGPFSIEVWLYPLATLTNAGIITFSSYTADSRLSVTYYNAEGIGISTAAGWILWPSTQPPANQWCHYVVCRNTAGLLAIFYNGIRQTSTTYTSSIGLTVQCTIGAHSTGFNGYFGPMRISRGVTLYDPSVTTFPVPTAPPTSTANTSLLLNFTDAAILDSTGRNVLETVADAKTSSVVTKFAGGSMSFDGTGDYLFEPHSTLYEFGSGDFTIEFWARANSLSGTYTGVVGVWLAGNTVTANSWYVSLNAYSATNKFGFSYTQSNTSYELVFNATTSTGSWDHYAIVRSGGTLYGFKNGASQTLSSGSSTISGAINNGTAGLYVGTTGTDGGGTAFNGYIQDLRITRGYARYTANFTAPTAPARLK
jgi:hypothetical protein